MSFDIFLDSVDSGGYKIWKKEKMESQRPPKQVVIGNKTSNPPATETQHTLYDA